MSSDLHIELIEKINSKTAKIGVIGLGYVGLPLVIAFSKAGFDVVGFDIDDEKVNLLNRGESYIKHIDITPIKQNSKFKATSDFSKLSEVDVIIICVPTPLNRYREPDMSFVLNTGETISRYLRRGQLVVLESTVYPGATDEDLKPVLEKSGLKAGVDFFLAFSPEREDPGNKGFSLSNIPKVVGGYTEKCLEVAKALYSKVVAKVVPVSSTRTAEAVKLLENIYRSVNIALVNELKMLFDRMGIDIWEVIEAAKTKPFGFQAFYPGPGLGGHCVDGAEMILIKNCDSTQLLTLSELFEREASANGVYRIGELEYVRVKNLYIDSFDIVTLNPCLRSITYLFRRNYDGKIIKIIASDNRTLKVTDKHPMLRIVNGKEIEVVFAESLKVGDLLPIFLGGTNSAVKNRIVIDFIKELDEPWGKSVRVRLRDGSWKIYKDVIYSSIEGEFKYDFIRSDYIPLWFLWKMERENRLKVDHKNLFLEMGRGNFSRKMPAVIEIDENWARLIGYYLSEGCATKEKNRYRIRITISKEETELYNDIKKTLSYIGLTYSEYVSKIYKSRTIRINSPLVGWLIIDRLKCGTNSYNMRIPDEIMASEDKVKKALLVGLFRGDGDVYVRSGKRRYIKNGREYTHNDNSITIGYFTISNILFNQVLYLLQEMGIKPSISRRKNRLLINGWDQVVQVFDWFLDRKGEKVRKYLNGVRRKTKKRSGSEIPSVKVKSIEVENVKNMPVYSIEVDGTHTFAVGKGIYVHNCIPVDPFYLTWKAREYDFQTRFIELAGEINTYMPYYVVQKTIEALNRKEKSISGARILLLGLAYKKDVDDARESPAFKLMELFEEKGAVVDYNDPYIPLLPRTRKYKANSKQSVPLTEENLSKYDCVVIATDHSVYDPDFIVRHANLVVDTRGLIKDKNEKVVKA
jgi:nucleotide sugar dehydrogenase